MTDSERCHQGERVDVVVIGAGLSGLVVAHTLRDAGFSVVTVEASDRAGGVLGTRERDGYRYETAANSALDDGRTFAPLLGALGIAGQRIDASPRASKRFVVRDGRLQPLPTSPPALLTNTTFSARARFRLLREPFIARAPRDAEESVAAFARRRLGEEWLDYAIDPFVSGVHAGDPESLSLRAAFPRLHALEQAHGSLLLGQVRRARERGRAPSPKSFSFKAGMRTLTDALAARVDVITSTRAALVSQERGGYAVELAGPRGSQRLHSCSVVIATAADAAAALVEPLSPRAARQLAAIVYAPVAIVVAAYRREDVEHPLDGFGFLVPWRERRPLLGTLFSSTMFEGRAPSGRVLLTTFVGGQRNPAMAAMDDASLREIVGRELTALLGARNVEWMDVVRWPRAIPQYTLGHEQRVATIDDAMAPFPGLFISANWRGGVSLADCIVRSGRTASAVEAFLGRPAPDAVSPPKGSIAR